MRKNQYYYENLYKSINAVPNDDISWLKNLFNHYARNRRVIEKVIDVLYYKIKKLFKLDISKKDVYTFLGCKRNDLKNQILKSLVFYKYSIVDFVYFFDINEEKYEIDIIVPVKKFDLSSIEGVKSVFNYKNLQVTLKKKKKVGRKPSTTLKRINSQDYLGPFWNC